MTKNKSYVLHKKDEYIKWRKAALQNAVKEGVLENPNPPIVQSVIKTTENSSAHIYAQEHGIPFELI